MPSLSVHERPRTDYARLRIHGLRTLYIEADLFADHHLRKRKLGRIRGRNIADILTAAEYRNAVGHRQHLMSLCVIMMIDFPSSLIFLIMLNSFSVS